MTDSTIKPETVSPEITQYDTLYNAYHYLKRCEGVSMEEDKPNVDRAFEILEKLVRYQKPVIKEKSHLHCDCNICSPAPVSRYQEICCECFKPLSGWWPIETAPKDGTVLEVPHLVRYLPYKEQARKQGYGHGRWQEHNGFGWQNINWEPTGFRIASPKQETVAKPIDVTDKYDLEGRN